MRGLHLDRLQLTYSRLKSPRSVKCDMEKSRDPAETPSMRAGRKVLPNVREIKMVENLFSSETDLWAKKQS